MTSVTTAIQHYSNLFHEQTFKQLNLQENLKTGLQENLKTEVSNVIMSPLGSWLLAAMETVGDENSYSAETVEILSSKFGLTIEEAFSTVRNMLSNVPASVNASAAAWVNSTAAKAELTAWLKKVESAGVDTSETMPDKQFLDSWVERESLGLITEFPFTPAPDTFIVLATILACKVQWYTPFESVKTPAELAFWDVPEVLLSYSTAPGVIVHGKKTYGVHVASAPGMNVVSVIGDEDELAEEVLKVAMDIASDLSALQKKNGANTIPDSGAFWSVHHETRTGYRVNDTETITKLPAWSAAGEYKLNDEAYGVTAAGEPLRDFFFSETSQETVQVAVARFNRYGFEAAALTTARFGSASMPRMETKEVTVITVDFVHPYAVVAVPQLPFRESESVWQGVPLFTAWVSEADEVDGIIPRSR